MEENNQTLHNFVLDSSFCDWVLDRDEKASIYWRGYLEANSDKRDLVLQAKSMVLAMTSKEEIKLSPAEKAELWDKIHYKVKSKGDATLYDLAPVRTLVSTSWNYALRMVASFTAILMISVALYLMYTRGQGETYQYATSYGEVKKVFLPDGTGVVLNANSSLTFQKSWDAESTREVNLKGEAFFNVTHQKNNQKFKVKLAEGVAIEVLGTQFTAVQRPHETSVVLKEGKVKFSVTSDAMLGLLTDTLAQQTLQPGELVAMRQLPAGVVLEKRITQHPEVYGAFQYNKLMFIDAPLTEVARVLENVYGYQVTFKNKEVLTRRFTGTVPHDRVEVLLTALEKLFQIQINQKGNQLEII